MMSESRPKNNLGDSTTPDTWAPTPDTIRDERWESEYLEELNQEQRFRERELAEEHGVNNGEEI